MDMGSTQANHYRGSNGAANGRALDKGTYFARAQFNLETRQNSEYGLVRTVASFRLNTLSGYNASAGQSGGTGTASMDKAYLQFGGLTAGRYESFLAGHAGAFNYSFANVGYDDRTVVGAAYTLSLGAGVTATVSVEDPVSLRANNAGIGNGAAAGSVVNYGGVNLPDVVGKARYEQAWGYVELGGLVHAINPVAYNLGGTDYGYAVEANTKFNLPMLGAGDALYVEAVYADGAVLAAGNPTLLIGRNRGANFLGAGGVGYADAIVNATATGFKTVTAWSAGAQVQHWWTPKWNSVLGGGYHSLNLPANATNFPDIKTYGVFAQLNWVPITNFKIGGEVGYRNVKLGTANYNAALSKTADAIEGRLRIQRDF